MTWATPKTDWDTDDAVGTTDLNRIEGNTAALKVTDDKLYPILTQIKGTASLDAGTKKLTIDNPTTVGGNFFDVSDQYGDTVHFITTANVTSGTVLYIRGSGLTLSHNESSPPSGFAAIWCNTVADIILGAAVSPGPYRQGIAALIFDGTYWCVIGN